MRTGLIQECKRRRFFENKHDEKKRKFREAAKRKCRRFFPILLFLHFRIYVNVGEYPTFLPSVSWICECTVAILVQLKATMT